uniref:Homologous recombination OB-fold protein OB-fold domain-containing protein n=1 Tax=Mola mola TaxID=94237 RepID=A0A3Q3XG99_MOLML
SVRTPSPCPPRASSPRPDLAPQQGRSHTAGAPGPCGAQDDFDDWDVDLADLDECDQPLHPPAPAPPADSPASSARTLRPPSCGGLQSQSHQSRRELSTAATIGYKEPPWTPSAPFQSPNTRPAFPSALPHSRNTFTAPSPISRPLNRPQRPWAPPARSPQAPPQTVSPGPSSSSSTSLSASALSPHPLHTPVLTNRLVQLVSASSKRPAKRPRSECHRPRTRRFPGPAGLLPEQVGLSRLDQIVVSVPVLPAHGAVARTPSQGSSSQTDDEEFLGGAWAAMKAEMGLDETNPSCFLHSYSVVMVLRKVMSSLHNTGNRQRSRYTFTKVTAALKQLAKNKVPNMAVLLKSIVHTHVDAKAVFKDPTGEIQGTVHRHLLKDRVDELKVGAVLLLKQVGVFSPSHRNHYLNVTANNLLRIYAPDGVGLSSTPLPPLVLVSGTTARLSADTYCCQLSHSNICFLFVFRSPCRHRPPGQPASCGSPCLRCTWCLTMRMTKDRPQETLTAAPAESRESLLGPQPRRTPTGIQVRRLLSNNMRAGRIISALHPGFAKIRLK